MKKGIIKAMALIVVFCAAVVTFGYYTNQNGANLTMEMQEASYPLLSVYDQDYLVAQLHGYRNQMDVTTMRDSVIPMPPDRKITLEINTYGSAIDQVSYEIRSLDGERLIANRTCDLPESDNELLTLDLTLENMVEQGEEYQLLFLVERGDENIRYYTRLMKNTDEHLEDYLAFVNAFHEATLNGDEEELSTYLEPNGTMENNDLHLVTINSSLQEVAWGDFECQQLTDSVLTIGELNDSYAVLTLEYVLTAQGTSGELEYYNAREYYRVSYNEEGERCYLHNYERSLDQIFRSDGENFYENYLQLGIRDEDVEYKKSENGEITCFVQQGELWSYNEDNGTLYRIFSFRGYEGIDARENYGAHDVKILGIYEGGSVDFAVCGYMNRGAHEGQVGISVCHFDSAAGTVEELLFVESDKSYSRLKVDMGQVLYENAEGVLYCMMEGSIYRINTADGSSSTLVSGLGSDTYCVSDDGRLLVWQEESDALTVMDLERQHIGTLQADSGEILYPIGFLEDDFVYGAAKTKNAAMADGTIPMSRVVIYDIGNDAVLKEYSKKDYLISGVTIDEYVINLQRLKISDEGYQEAASDTILNHEGEEILDDNIQKTYDEKKQMQVQIALGSQSRHNNANVINSKEVLLEEQRLLDLSVEDPWQGYYIYAKGECLAFCSRLTDAIAQADAEMGVVVDSRQQTLWKRGKRASKNPINLPESFDPLHPEKSYPDATVLDLTGAKLSQTLYYLSEGLPVQVTLSDGTTEFLVGYDSSGVWIYDAADGETKRQAITDTEQRYNVIGVRYTVFLH